jgi:hypothetical protein
MQRRTSGIVLEGVVSDVTGDRSVFEYRMRRRSQGLLLALGAAVVSVISLLCAVAITTFLFPAAVFGGIAPFLLGSEWVDHKLEEPKEITYLDGWIDRLRAELSARSGRGAQSRP